MGKWKPPDKLARFKSPWRYDEWNYSLDMEYSRLGILGGWLSGGKLDRDWGARHRLLRESVELLKGEPDNGADALEVLEKSLGAEEFDLAKEVTLAVSPDAPFYFCECVSALFETIYAWEQLDDSFVGQCETRVLAAPICRHGVGYRQPDMKEVHYPDERSRALARIGRFLFFTTSAEAAVRSWSQADDAFDVDEVLGEMVRTIVFDEPKRTASARNLAQMINDSDLRKRKLAWVKSSGGR